MYASRILAFALLLRASIYAATIINNDWQQHLLDSVDEYRIRDVENENNNECPILANGLREEIRSYQPIVDKIVAAIINGTYSGDTWNA